MENLSIIGAITAAYVAGVITSFTPCVYPLVPIVAGSIGAATDKKLKGFLLSLVYVGGMSITYAVLGLSASLAGRMFGFTSQNFYVNLFVAVILIIFGLAMADFIKIPLIGLKSPVEGKNSKTWAGIFILGILSGLVAAPCATPVLGSILTLVAVEKSIAKGITLLFIYGFGTGTLLILVGTFSGFASNLPKSGRWMYRLKKIFGLVIIITGIYFLLWRAFHLF